MYTYTFVVSESPCWCEANNYTPVRVFYGTRHHEVEAAAETWKAEQEKKQTPGSASWFQVSAVESEAVLGLLGA